MTTRQMQPTSLEAFEDIKHKLGLAQQRILDVFYEYPNVRDWTNLELARNLGWDINRVTPRVYELRMLGILIESRTRECKITSRNALAWRIKQ